MSERSKIEWCDSTWSPIRARVRMDAPSIARDKGHRSLVQIAERMRGHVGQHCERVSPGCEHCYAETNNHRCLPNNGTGLPYNWRSRDLVEAFVDQNTLVKPLGWKSIRSPGLATLTADGKARGGSRPQLIFVENQSDLFGDWVPDELIDQVFAIMALCPQHVFQVLTKRPERMLSYLNNNDRAQEIGIAAGNMLDGTWIWNAGKPFRQRIESVVSQSLGLEADGETQASRDLLPLPNVWLGVSAENQITANARIPLLLQTPAAVRFISAEPLLGPLNLERILYRDDDVDCLWNCLTAYHEILNSTSMDIVATADDGVTKLDWVICGGESGPGARPMHPDWARLLRDQCSAAGVPYFFKQHGEWISLVDYDPFVHGKDTKQYPHSFTWRTGEKNDAELPISAFRVGKKAAGALLDGVEHKAFPEAGSRP